MKKLEYIKTILAITFVVVIAFSCQDEFLDFTPTGVISSEELNTPEQVEKLVISAYASLGNDHVWQPYQYLWPYGSVRADDSYKGGGDISDQFDYALLETFQAITPNPGYYNTIWVKIYSGISRANDALRRLANMTDSEFPNKSERIAEMRFIRGHYEFILKILYKHIPYIDENVSVEDIPTLSNHKLTDQEGWAYIADEFRAALAVLPETQAEDGRPTKNAARAYLAKTLLYKAYVQDENHQVVSITQSELEEVISLVDDIEATGAHDLSTDIAENFLAEFEDRPEVVWAIMRSIQDGSNDGRLNFSSALNSSMGPGYGCCWFNIPAKTLINAFKTDANGLPLFQTFNEAPSIDDAQDVLDNNMDPRMGHTAVVPGMPWKYDPNRIFDDTYLRASAVYGNTGALKDQEHPDSPDFRAFGAFFGTAKNTDIIRYADVLLFKAEALIELGRMDEALPIINRIRSRAATSTTRLVYADGSPSGNWNVGQYATLGSQDNARKILQWERRLEFAMEAVRFFDLVRWGIAGPTMTEYFDVEKERRDYLKSAEFTVGTHEYLPIPQAQIIIGKGVYEQNPGY